MNRRILYSVSALLAVALHAAALAQQPPPPPPPPGQAPPPAPGYNPNSAAVRQPTAYLQASAPPSTASLQSNVPIFNPAYPNVPSGGGYPFGWGGGLGMGRYGGYMQGAANLTVANAQYNLTTQQARIVRQQANREQLLTNRATMEERQYESDQWQQRHDPDTVRQQDQERTLQRSLHNPPETEIWSGVALNAALKDIQNATSNGVSAPPVPLDSGTLARINLTDGTNYNGVGMLKNLNKFDWPLVCRKEAFANDRQQIEEMSRKAVGQVMSNSLDPDLLDKLNDAVGTMKNDVDTAAPNMTPTQYIQASRYLGEVKQSLKVLQDPNVGNYFNKKWTAQGTTVNELVQNMTGQGLKFAPAAPGEEAAYTSLHSSMVTYIDRLRQFATR
jgi:hypothetical protein